MPLEETTYYLGIDQGPGRPLLSATLVQGPDKVLNVTHASIHVDGAGGVSLQGMDAYRCLCMAELIIAAALKTDTIDPFAARVELLEAEVQRLRQVITAGQTPDL
jgi:hypothetical protein